MIQTICTCGERYEVRDDLAGKRMRCIACSAVMFVPGRRPSAPTHAAAARSGGNKSEGAGSYMRSSSLVTGAIAGFLAIAVVWVVLTPRPAAPAEAPKAAPQKAKPAATRPVTP